MALSLSSTDQNFLVLSPPTLFSSPKPYPKTLSLHYKPILALQFHNSLSSINRRSFKSSFSVENSDPNTNNEEEVEGVENDEKAEAERESPSDLITAIKVYKEAIISGDETAVSDIEAMIFGIETEKNEVLLRVSNIVAELNSSKEKYIRLQADFDNFRKRSENERLSIRTNAQGEVIESLLPMVDNFERAKQQLKLETEKEISIETSYQGIYKQFLEIMRSLDVAAVETVGKPFDPSLHEAIAREESDEFEEGIVLEEFRRGFLLGDRLLRPAMVKVSAGPGPAVTISPVPVDDTLAEVDETSTVAQQ